jgi:tetratricopeptide (TPR) repeat protein
MAIEQFTEAIRLDPQDADAYGNRGLSYGELGEHQRAIKDYTEVIRLNPQRKYALAYYNRAMAYSSLGMDEEAARDWAKYRELSGR